MKPRTTQSQILTPLPPAAVDPAGWFLVHLLAAFSLLASFAFLAGCTSTIKGGTSSETTDRTSTSTGAQTSLADNVWMKWGARQQQLLHDTLITFHPDGKVTIAFQHHESTTRPADESRHEHREATSQPVTVETAHRATATTGPSASSVAGLKNFKADADGNVSGTWFDAGAVAEQLKARAFMAGPFVLAAIVFVLLSRWLQAAACVVAAIVILLVPTWIVVTVIVVFALGIGGWVVWELEVKHRSLAELKADVRAMGTNSQPAAGTPAANL